MERHGTDDIPIRVQHLESSVDRLHQDNQTTQRTLASVVAQLEAVSRSISDIGSKLDVARTQKPNISTIAAAVTVILTIGALSFAPVYREMTRSHEYHEWVTERVIEAIEERAENRAAQDAFRRELDQIQKDIDRNDLLQRAGR